MISLQPFQGLLDGERCLIMGYMPEADRLLVYGAKGEILCPERDAVTVDWHYNEAAAGWMMNPQEQTEELLQALEIAMRGLQAIAEYDHLPECANKDDFEVWDCNCNQLKPSLMAQLTLEEIESEDEPTEEVPVPDVHDADPE